MIDIHCHLEYMENPEQVVEEAKQKMSAVISSVADMKDKDKVMELREKAPAPVFRIVIVSVAVVPVSTIPNPRFRSSMGGSESLTRMSGASARVTR